MTIHIVTLSITVSLLGFLLFIERFHLERIISYISLHVNDVTILQKSENILYNFLFSLICI